MTTVTPSRPAPVRGGSSRTRGPSAGARGASIDPFRVLRRHLFALIVAVLGGAILGTIAFFLFYRYYPLYSGEVLFEVQPGLAEAGDIGTRDTVTDEDVRITAKTQLVLLVNRQVLLDAVGDPNVRQTTWFRSYFIDEDGSELPLDAVDELEEDLGTSIVRGTQLFRLKWSTHDKRDIPTVLDAVARAYNDYRERLDNEVYNNNLVEFTNLLKDTNQRIEDLDLQIQEFIREHGIESLDDTRYSQAAGALREITARIAAAQSALSIDGVNYLQTAAKLEGTLEFSAEDILEAEMDYSVAGHINLVRGLSVDLRVINDKFGPDHPEVREMGIRLRAAEAEKQSRLEEVVRRNLNARLKEFGFNIERFRQMQDDLESEAEIKEKELRDLAAVQSSFQGLQKRREYLEEGREGDQQLIKELRMLRARKDAERVRIAQWAETPRELAFPLPEIIIPMGALIVLALTVGVIFLRELTDQRVKSASDLAVLPGARVLGVIPELDEDPTKCKSAELVLRRYPNSVLAESYRQTCAPLSKALDRAGHQTLLLMGGLPLAGTTTAASNIAAGYAAAGRRVLLVDANFRRPRLAEVMGVDAAAAGLGDLLDDAVTIDEAIQSVDELLHVIGAGTAASRIIERLNTERFDSLVAELRGRYDLVIFDAPPAVVAGDAMVLANRLDAAVLVIRANQEHRGLVVRVMNQLADTQCELLGIVLNRPRGTAGGYFKKNFATMAAYARKTD